MLRPQSHEPARAEVLFSGQVQGVGFRYRALLVAEEHVVTGYIRNLPNGKVEVVVEGVRSNVDGFLAGLRSRMAGYIVDEILDWQEPEESFRGFAVRY